MEMQLAFQKQVKMSIQSTEQVHHTRGKQSTPSGSTSTAEISKKQLLQLAKTDMTAQAVNLQYDELNTFLLAE